MVFKDKLINKRKDGYYLQKLGFIALLILFFLPLVNSVGNKVYFYDLPDIEPISIGFWAGVSSVGDTIVITLVLENRGSTISDPFEVYFYENTILSNGENKSRIIGKEIVDGLEEFTYEEITNESERKIYGTQRIYGLKQVNVTWIPNSPGIYNFYMIVDPNNKIKEWNEENNVYYYNGDQGHIYTKGPLAEITTPENGAIFRENELIAFSGRGTDVKEGWLNESNFVWKSDKDGFLGNGGVVIFNQESMFKDYYKNIELTEEQKNELEKLEKELKKTSKKLSKGIHKISLTVKNKEAVENTDYIIIGVYSEGEKSIEINATRLEPPKVYVKEVDNNFFDNILSWFIKKFKVYSIYWDNIPNSKYYQYNLDTSGWKNIKDNIIRLRISNEGVHNIQVRGINEFEIEGQEGAEIIYINNLSK
ncbi:MAG: CARDB domain-containing protein [Candidatus Nanoarchaeia archaeon]|nr:CARDB domain-containing protein [Candidatus Nanoarchaeia archaeon]